MYESDIWLLERRCLLAAFKVAGLARDEGCRGEVGVVEGVPGLPEFSPGASKSVGGEREVSAATAAIISSRFDATVAEELAMTVPGGSASVLIGVVAEEGDAARVSTELVAGG